jgi:tetratricopeptide (TPR) repeat protein
VPNGVNPEIFHPQVAPMKLATQKKFKLLFVGGTIFRKGPDLLLKAFQENFTAADDVCLVIKDFGGQTVYAGQTFESQIRAAQSRPNAPEILYLNEELPPDSLPGLYTACDCLVLPYRGEGFGLPVLEAMACGLPVMVTAGGATDDFVRDDFAWRIPAERRIFGYEISGLKLIGAGWLLEPDVAALGRFMREAFARPAETRRRGQLGAEHARQFYSWQNAAAIAARRIHELGRADLPARPGAPQRVPATKAAPAPKVKITLPPCALIGHLTEARELVRKKQFRAAWDAALSAFAKRPFHPEAALLLAEIAQIVGDGQSAKLCAEYARRIAPGWKPAKKFLNQRLKGSARPGWLKLPDAVNSEPSGPPKRNEGGTTLNPKLSVCLIVKNEEKFIGQCLKSIRELAAQIVVVDTGSTDRTVEIAKEHGAEVHSFAWCDDFSAARNAALEHAAGDWVLMLDADEELSAAGREKLKAAMNDSAVMAWRLPIVDVGREADGCSYVPRFYRNAPGLFYIGRVHEQVFSSIEVRRAEWGLENRLSDAMLIHHGYTAELTQDRNKVERNLKLLERAVEEMPDEPHLLMNLGLELSRSGRETEALERYREAFESLSSKPAAEIVPELRETLLMQYCTRLMAAKRFDEVVRVLVSPLAGMGGGLTASLHFSLGLSHLELGQFGEAAGQMRQCLAKRQQRCLAPINKEINTAAPHHCLALCLARSGDAAAAEQAFQDGLNETGHADALKLDYARFLAGHNRAVDALRQLHELVAKNAQHPGAWQLGGQIALSRPEFLEFARDWTGEAMRQVAKDPRIIAQRAEALMLSEDVVGALELWEQVWNQAPQPDVLAALILCETVESPTTHAPPDDPGEAAASRAFIEWYRKLLAVKAHKTIVRLNEQTDKLSRALPGAARMLEAAMSEASRAGA